MAKLPFMQFYVSDWLTDPALTRCSAETRGVWIDLLCAMHLNGRVGSLRGTADELARLARCVPAVLVLALTDLQTTEAAAVTERNGVWEVSNRRMLRDAQRREGNRLRQAKSRAGPEGSNDSVTTESRLSSLLPSGVCLLEVLEVSEFKEMLVSWLTYKEERREEYTDQGIKNMLKLAARRAKEHGIEAVTSAMERAMASNWQGWDQDSSFVKQETYRGRRVPDCRP